MSSKIIISAALLMVARASVIAPSATTVDNVSNPQYSFGYDVEDPFTGDSKSQVETRNGDVVEGSYSLNEPDGSRRIVDYRADTSGFNAVVRKSPLVHATANLLTPVVGKVAALKPLVPLTQVKTAVPVSQVESFAPVLAKLAPVTNAVIGSSSHVVHGSPAEARFPSSYPYDYGVYSAPVLNHLTYSSTPYNFGYVNRAFYSPIPQYYHY